MEEQNKKNWAKSEIPKAVWTGIVIFISIIFAYLLFYSILEIQGNINPPKNKSTDNTILISQLKRIPLEAEAIFIWDVYNQREIFSQNKEAQLPLASLSKVMTALIASEYEDKNITVNINERNLEKNGNSGLVKNEKWDLKELIDFTLISSSNDGASAVASAIQSFTKNENNEEVSFVEKMNEKAKTLNLKQTYFLNESGLDIDESSLSGSYGSAQDIAMLFDYIVKNKPEILEVTSYDKLELKSEDNKIHNAENTNLAINDIPWVIGSKTGYTDLAGGNLTVVFDNGMMRPIIISVLGSSKEGRFKDMKKLVDVVLQYKNVSE